MFQFMCCFTGLLISFMLNAIAWTYTLDSFHPVNERKKILRVKGIMTWSFGPVFQLA